MLSKKLVQRLRQIYTLNSLSSYNISFLDFKSLAEAQRYRPWKELVLKDKSKGFKLDNMLFTYSNPPRKLKVSSKNKETEKIYLIRALGKALLEFEDIGDEIERLILNNKGSFDKETLNTMLSYLEAVRRGYTNCLGYIDTLSTDGKFIRGEYKSFSAVCRDLNSNCKALQVDKFPGVELAGSTLSEHDFRELGSGVNLWQEDV